MFYLAKYPDDPPGYEVLSESANWLSWLKNVIPTGIHKDVRNRLCSNLKHILVGLEMKAALIKPHATKISKKSVLFEPYCQIMTFEFNVGVFSVCEGIGAVHYLSEIGDDGSTSTHVKKDHWMEALCRQFDHSSEANLKSNLACVNSVRDKMHQDKLGARVKIDWHDFGYEKAFLPAFDALQPLLNKHVDEVPVQTNLLGH
jgi:hypothetical protein